MISVPVAVHSSLFEWQLDLFWFNHRLTYGHAAKNKARAIIIKRNTPEEPKHEAMEWGIDVPHDMCESFFDYERNPGEMNHLHAPLNIQIGLLQVIDRYDDDQIIEVLDCDMLHFRKHLEIVPREDEFIVCDFYEAWHLKSLTDHRAVIERYLCNRGGYYNGGFVPIIGRVKTFKRMLEDWASIHRDILSHEWPDNVKWWAGMYALQAACERAQIRMVADDCCYISNINTISSRHYVAHYACDARFDKKKYPNLHMSDFPDNDFYNRLRLWPRLAATTAQGELAQRGREVPVTAPTNRAACERDHATVLRVIAEARAVQRYLEIGSGGAEPSYHQIKCPVKHRIDVRNMGSSHSNAVGRAQSSDDFFAGLAHESAQSPLYDLIFVDGLHHAEQVKRDICDALHWCAVGGTVVVHDCWPNRQEHTAREPHPVAWLGDVWKGVVQIAEENPELDFRTWPGDHGVCVMRRGAEGSPLQPYREKDYYTWEFYLQYRYQLLREVDWQGLWRWYFSA